MLDNPNLDGSINISVVNGRVVGFDQGWYIGRGGKGLKGSALANPFRIPQDGTRTEVIEKYRHWLWNKIQHNDKAVLSELTELLRKAQSTSVTLVCFCAPLPCHGDVIIACLKWMQTNETYRISQNSQSIQ